MENAVEVSCNSVLRVTNEWTTPRGRQVCPGPNLECLAIVRWYIDYFKFRLQNLPAIGCMRMAADIIFQYYLVITGNTMKSQAAATCERFNLDASMACSSILAITDTLSSDESPM